MHIYTYAYINIHKHLNNDNSNNGNNNTRQRSQSYMLKSKVVVEKVVFYVCSCFCVIIEFPNVMYSWNKHVSKC